MRSPGADRAAIVYLQRLIITNWLRRSMRSPFFWIVAAFVAFVLVLQIAAIIDGPDEPGILGELDQMYVNVVAAIVLLGGILVGIWRGATNTPGASLADVVLLLRTPISRRMQYGLLMARPSALNALIISIWALAGLSGVLIGADDSWISLRLLFSVMIVVLISELLRYAVWVGTEQIAAHAPRSGDWMRLLIRLVVGGIGIAVGGYIVWPLLDQTAGDWRAAVDTLADRGQVLTAIPPMSLAASVFDPAGASLLSAIGLLAMAAGAAALALSWARDFVEPIAITSERKTDARGQMMEPGSDVQWAALTQFGVSPRMRVTVPAFGRGAWALLWGSLTRWVRYQVAAAWITLVVLGLLGALTTIGIRLGFIPQESSWVAALVLPFFGSVNMFLDELRRHFIFLIPGSTRARLTTAAVTSVLDGSVSSLIVILTMTLFGVVPLFHAAGLVLLSMAIALLAQSSLALVQVLAPFWTGQRLRVTMTFGFTGVAFLPALGVLIGAYVVVGPIVALLSASLVTTLSGLLLMGLAGYLFDRVDYLG